MRTICSGSKRTLPARLSIMTKSLPAPFILVNRNMMSIQCSGGCLNDNVAQEQICRLVVAHAKADLGRLRRGHRARRRRREPQFANSRASPKDAERRQVLRLALRQN